MQRIIKDLFFILCSLCKEKKNAINGLNQCFYSLINMYQINSMFLDFNFERSSFKKNITLVKEIYILLINRFRLKARS